MVRASVFLIDDHPVVALGLRIALARSPSLFIAGTHSNPDLGLHHSIAAKPDCLVLDLVYSGNVRFPLIQEARKDLRDTTLIVFTSLPARLYARDALSAGADAYLEKDADMATLVGLIERLTLAVRSVHTSASPDHLSSLHEATVIDGVHLSRREMQIAALVGRGQLPARIAAELNISPRTVAAHRENIRRKLNCRNSKELIARLARLDAGN